MREFSDEQRRARLGARHGLAHRFGSVPEAVEQMTCLHATEPASVYLSAFARAEVSRADIHRALYDERSVVKQLAMRRTLFAFPRTLLPAVWGSASDRVGDHAEHPVGEGGGEQRPRHRRRRVVDPDDRRGAGVLWPTGRPPPLSFASGSRPLAQRLELSPGKAYGGSFPIAPRFLGTVAATGQILRGDNAGDWHVSQASVDVDGRLVGGTAPAGRLRDGLPRPRRALAAHVRSRHGGRPRLVARRDQERRTPCTRRAGCRGGGDQRGSGLRPSRRPGRRTRTGALGGPAPGPRPDDDGVEAARLLPRSGRRPAPVRLQRQRRHHRLVERARGRVLGPGRRRRRLGGPAPRRRLRRAQRAGRRGEPGSARGWPGSGSARSTRRP